MEQQQQQQQKRWPNKSFVYTGMRSREHSATDRDTKWEEPHSQTGRARTAGPRVFASRSRGSLRSGLLPEGRWYSWYIRDPPPPSLDDDPSLILISMHVYTGGKGWLGRGVAVTLHCFLITAMEAAEGQ